MSAGDEKAVKAPAVYFDTEFIEDGATIDLLSIGLVRTDGAEYYAEAAEADRSRADDWVRANVLPNLTGPIKPRAVIAAEVVAFAGPRPEFWAWYADYDWVALCQLFGRMVDLPDGWPMYCRDLRQVCDSGDIQLAHPDSIHNALHDARWLASVAPVALAAERDRIRAEARREALDSIADDLWRATPCGCGHRADLHLLDTGACIGGLTLCDCPRSFTSIVAARIRALKGTPEETDHA